MAMTPEELRDAILRAQGWEEDPNDLEFYRRGDGGAVIDFSTRYDLPDPTTSIAAAMCLAVEISTNEQFLIYLSPHFCDVTIENEVRFISIPFGIGDIEAMCTAISRDWLIWHEEAK
jgi:hypothetical protein